jgi:thioredoxin reductase (NADPH)
MRPLKNLCEVAVIGGGLAGLSAARHAVRLGRLATLFEGGGLFGGQVATVGEVDGLPTPGQLSGQDLAIPLAEAARAAGARIVEEGIVRIEVGETLRLIDGAGAEHRPDAVIVAAGVAPRKLGVIGEEALFGSGVSRCATCDGGFFRGRDVVVVGGGDAAAHEALVLAKTSRQVIVVSRSPLKAKREYVDKLVARENVRFVWGCEVEEILGADRVTGVRLRNLADGGASVIECAGVFPFIGGEPNSGLFPAAWRSASGHLLAGPDFATADPRFFAAGAVRAGYDGNLVQAMAEGVGAAEAANRLLTRRASRLMA